MIKELSESNIQILPQVDSWEEAIKIASRPLLEKGYIEPRYIDTMISKVNELGFYIVLWKMWQCPTLAQRMVF